MDGEMGGWLGFGFLEKNLELVMFRGERGFVAGGKDTFLGFEFLDLFDLDGNLLVNWFVNQLTKYRINQ